MAEHVEVLTVIERAGDLAAIDAGAQSFGRFAIGRQVAGVVRVVEPAHAAHIAAERVDRQPGRSGRRRRHRVARCARGFGVAAEAGQFGRQMRMTSLQPTARRQHAFVLAEPIEREHQTDQRLGAIDFDAIGGEEPAHRQRRAAFAEFEVAGFEQRLDLLLPFEFGRGLDARPLPQQVAREPEQARHQHRERQRERGAQRFAPRVATQPRPRAGAGDADRPAIVQRLQVGGERRHVRIAVGGALLQRLVEHRQQLDRASGTERTRIRRIAAQHVLQHRLGAVAVERAAQRQQFVEGDAECEHVALRRRLPTAVGDDLRRHVVRGAGEVAGLGQARALVVAGEPEVGQQRRAVGAQQDVGRLHVAVHDAVRMYVGECLRDRQQARYGGGLRIAAAQLATGVGCVEFELQRAAQAFAAVGGGRQLPAARDHVRQRAAVDEVHREVPAVVEHAGLVHRDEVVVAQAGQQLRLALEAGARGRAGGAIGRQQLQGDGATERALHGFVHFAHAAAAEQAHQPEVAE